MHKFSITDEEYSVLDKKFGKLCYYAAWKLINRNKHNNCEVEMELEDVVQEVKMHLVKAGVYYKRQVYIENSLKVLKEFSNDAFISKLIDELQYLWNNRKRHGANKKKFGDYQESLLDMFLKKLVPAKQRPDPHANIVMDNKLAIYVKSILWNSCKNIGKKATKEYGIRKEMVFLDSKTFTI